MTKYTVKEGCKAARPGVFNISRSPCAIAWQVKLTEEFIYELEGSQQNDFLKLCGLAFFTVDLAGAKRLLQGRFNHWNSIMMGVRYNLSIDKAQLSPYLHINDKVYYYGKDDTSYLLDMPLGKTFYPFFEIRYPSKDLREYRVCIQVDGVVTEARYSAPHKAVLTEEINFYFGSDQVAPINVSVYKRRLGIVSIDKNTGLLDVPLKV